MSNEAKNQKHPTRRETHAMSDLLPCPFCGCGSQRIQKLHEHYQVCCNECGARTAAYQCKNDTIEAWNIRAE